MGYFQPEGIDYDPAIPVPAAILGHELGDEPVRHDRMQDFLATMAEISDRIAIETIGFSHEGRPINLLVITSPDNHARLDAIRARHLTLSDPEAGIVPDDNMPVVLWLGYGVHGTEAAGMETAIPVVYHLAAARGEAIERTLRETVILVAAVLNPDGHARRIDHMASYRTRAPVVDPAFAGNDLWARFRANHYWFDLNRQWLPLAHPEPRAWVSHWHRWKPHLSADFHEMGTTSVRPTSYYFSPGEKNRSHPQVPPAVRELKLRVAEFHSAAFDRDRKLYFTEEAFDNFYIGTGSSYPDVNGSIGFLFEVGTARSGKVVTALGERSHADNIRMHFTASLSSIDAAQTMRRDLLEFRRTFFAEARAQGRADERRAFVFNSPDRSRLAQFVDLLGRHDIEVFELARDVRADGVDHRAGEAFIVPLAQPQYRMIRSIFDRNREFPEAIFYDVSGWTVPLSYNLDHAALDRRSWSAALVGAAAGPAFPRAEAPAPASYGYAFSWTDHHAPRALYRLLDAGIIARVAKAPVTVRTEGGNVALGRGAIFVPLARQTVDEATIHDIVGTIARTDGIEVHAVRSGRTLESGADLGSGGSFETLEKPRVLLLFDDGIQSFDAGDIWHLMDWQMEIPAILKQKSRLGEIDWQRYTHLVLPGGRADRIGLDAAMTAKVRRWVVEDGGTVIGLRQGAAWFEEALLGRGGAPARGPALAPGTRYDHESYDLLEAEHVVGGTIFASDLDITHPLGFGFHRRFLPSHRDTAIVLATPENPYATVARYLAEGTVLSGYASERRVAEIADSPMMVAERLGKGSVILIADNPAFRGAWPGTAKLFLNSLFFSNMFGPPRNAGGAHYRP